MFARAVMELGLTQTLKQLEQAYSYNFQHNLIIKHKMINDIYHNRSKIYFGTSTERHMADEIPHGTMTLLHYGNHSLKAFGLYDKIITILNDNDIPYVELGGAQSNPKSNIVYKAIELCKKHHIKYVLAAGGGSVIDSAKAICTGATYDGDFSDLYIKKIKPYKALPLGVVLTNSGSGSESNNSSVITFENHKEKLGLDYVFPEFVIMNPENTFTVPIYTTICGLFDAITHILERYFSPTKEMEYSLEISETLIKRLFYCADKISKNTSDYNIRAEIMLVSRLAMDKGIYLGRKGDWACHHIAHVIGAYTDATHAEILSIIYPLWLKYIADKSDNYLLKRFSKEIMGQTNFSIGINNFRSLIKSWGLPITFSELGLLNKMNLKIIADKCSKINPSCTIGNYFRLSKIDVYNILCTAI